MMRLALRGVALGVAVAVGLGGAAQRVVYSATANSVLDSGPTAVAPVDVKTDVPVKAVTLYSSGVGYFQHSGTVDGNATAVLPFKVSQINDVLKSLLLEDKGGQVASVTYGSQDPLEKTLKSFQVDITANPSLAALLNQLRGAKVTISLADGPVEGTVLGVETRAMPAGENKTYDVPVLNLFNGTGVRSIVLSDALGIKLDDPSLQDELSRALGAVAAARDQDKRPVTVHFQGQGQRDVVIGYVTETPVWKASYRLVLGDKDDAKIQGWAIVENQTDNDWNNVELSLVSGRPISFVENLYQPIYVPRPMVQPDLYASLQPQTYAANDSLQLSPAEAEGDAAKAPGNGPRASGFGGGRGFVGQQAESLAERSANGGLAAATPINPITSVISAASAAKLGELFQYTIGSVSLPRQSSAMIPIVTDSIHAERVSIYNASVMPRNPLNGARLKNTTGKHLLGGPLTVLDGGSYAGDAQVDNLPPDQQRLVSFGIDLQMTVDQTNKGGSDEVLTGKIVKGVFEATYKSVSTTVYDAVNRSDHDETLVIEHPFNSGWTLVDTPDPGEKTDALYRFDRKIASGKSDHLEVKEQWIRDQIFAIMDNDVNAVIAFSQNGQLPKDVKDALVKAAQMKQGILDTQNRINQDRQKDQDIRTDQSRINETLRTIDRTTALYTRLLQKLNDQETQLEKLRGDAEEAQNQLNDQNHALSDYLNNLTVG
jgi:hypothetical protein